MLRPEFDAFKRRRLLRPMKVTRALASDLDSIRRLLVEAELPVEDLVAADVKFWIATDAAGITGAVGVEEFGNSGLMRSLVVAPRSRSHGTGSALVEELEVSMRSRGLKSLALLTQTAENFFAKRGYVRTPRDQVSEQVRRSGEFQTLCPASAVCMSKSL